MCRLTLYVYGGGSHSAGITHVADIPYFRDHLDLFGVDASNRSCVLESSCTEPTFAPLHKSVYSGDAVILQRLLETCALTTDPDRADLFVLPEPYGTTTGVAWGCKSDDQRHTPLCRRKGASSESALRRHSVAHPAMPYLTDATAARHVILCSTDVEWCPSFHANSTLINLGDDDVQSNMIRHSHSLFDRRMGRNGVRLPNALSVPYRVSQWIAPPPAGAAAPPPRRWLLSANLNNHRASCRAKLGAAIEAAAKASNDTNRVLISHSMLNPAEAADVARASTFCVCATGDAKGFTARFYFSLAAGCLPVFVDCWTRNLTLAELALPYPSLLNWSALVVVPPNSVGVPTGVGVRGADVLRLVREMPEAEVARRQRYLHSVAHWLAYDLEPSSEHPRHDRRDAPAALIRELELRFARIRDR